MGINGLIADIDSDRLNKDCILHGLLRIYTDKKSKLATCGHKEAGRLVEQLGEYSNILKGVAGFAKCFPDSCDDCDGLIKCMDCMINENCVDAHLMFYKLKLLTTSV